MAKRIEDAVLEFYEALVRQGKYGRGGLEWLKDADVKLEKLRLYLRLAQDLKLMSFDQYEHAARQVTEIGRLLGGWIQKETKETEKQPSSD